MTCSKILLTTRPKQYTILYYRSTNMEQLKNFVDEIAAIQHQDHSVPERQIFPMATAFMRYGAACITPDGGVAYNSRENVRLTINQYWCLRLAGLGLQYKEIAEVRDIAEQTIQNMFSANIFPKFSNVHHIVGAVVGGVALGVLNLEDLIEGRDFARYDLLKDNDKMLLDAYTANWQEEDMAHATASLIGRADNTVKNRLSRIYKVLGVRNNTEAVVYNLEVHRREMREAV